MKYLNIGLAFTTLSAVMSFAVAEQVLGVFETSAFMTLEWSDNRTEPLPTDSVFHIEEACSLYFSRLLEAKSHSAFQDPNEVLSTTVAVQKQRLDNGIMIIESGLKVVHLGDEGIVDLAALLMFLTNKNTTNSSFTNLDNLIGMEVHLDMVSFTNADESNLLSSGNSEDVGISSTKKYSDSEKTLIIVTSALSFSLFTLSIILIWVAGGWLALRKQVKVLIHREEELTRLTKQNNDEIKEKPTEDSDEESGDADDVTQFTNPSGILGVNPYYGQSSRTPGALDGLGIKMTPARESSEDGSSIFTPMSAQTNYSDTGRAPIGIMSMRKLVPGNGGGQDDRNSLGAFGIKRLEY